MKLRCDLAVNGGERKILICQGPSEPEEHLALKLGAYIQFWDRDPVLDASPKLPALAAFDFLPDVLCLDDAGDIALWVECGSYTMNKLTKLTRRVPLGRGRIVVMKATERDAQRMRADVDAQLDRPQRIEILAWPGDSFKSWVSAVAERTEIFGESSEQSLNLVVNQIPLAVDFRRY